MTASLNGADVSQVLDVITKANGLTWKKLEFARKEDAKVSLDQLKSGILALASMQLVGLSVQDTAAKTTSVFTKDVPTSAEAAKPALPEGYSWTTVYVVLAPEVAPAATTDANKVAALSKTQADTNGAGGEHDQGGAPAVLSEPVDVAAEDGAGSAAGHVHRPNGRDEKPGPASRDQIMQDMRAAFRRHARPSTGGQNGQNGQFGATAVVGRETRAQPVVTKTQTERSGQRPSALAYPNLATWARLALHDLEFFLLEAVEGVSRR